MLRAEEPVPGQEASAVQKKPPQPRPLPPQLAEDAVEAGRHGPLGHYMDEVLQVARQNGDMADLPGKGKPLNLAGVDPFGGPEAEVYRALKEANATPEWIDLQKEIRAELRWVRAHPDDPRWAEKVTALNDKIRRYNRLAPPQMHWPTYRDA